MLAKLARWWPFFAVISLLLIIIHFTMDIPYVRGISRILIAFTYGLILLNTYYTNEIKFARWRYVLGILFILILFVTGVISLFSN
ncbi:hypothetical protein MKX54_08900 [Alkalihalobacillus sp. FSL R5-0424]